MDICKYSRGFPGEGASNDSRVIENMDFECFRRYVFSTSGSETCKNRLPYNLYCVGGDVKHCSLTH